MTQTDDHGQPQTQEDQDQRPSTDAAQTMSLNTQQVAQQLGVDSRTVRRYINEGIRTPGGDVLRLEARQVRTHRGPEWQVYQSHLEEFKEERDRQATEGHVASQQLMRPEESQALATTSIQILATELERRSAALEHAQEAIERLAREAGQYAGRAQELERELEAERGKALEAGKQVERAQELERELEAERQRVTELEAERDHWQAKAQESPPQPRRVRLLPWQKKED